MLIDRKSYTDKLFQYKDDDVIKIVTGVRRSGKSTLFQLYIDQLKQQKVKSDQILRLNLEDPTYRELTTGPYQLYDYVKAHLPAGEKAYVFLDEIQLVPEFQKAVDGLYLDKNIDLYLTGSNAFLLSGELATLLSGRYIEIKMLPLSFSEIYTYAAHTHTDKYQLFLDYLRYGGMPVVASYLLSGQAAKINDYLDGIFSTIVFKDVMTRGKISDKAVLESIIQFLFDSIGSAVSPKRISDTLTSNGRNISNHTVENYLTMLAESFLIYKAERFDVKGKRLLARDYKYYAVDTGLVGYFMGRTPQQNFGHLLENVVYLELIRRDYRVFIGKVDEYEVDFVAQKDGRIEYYQVAASTLDDAVLERELRSLRHIGDSYPKFLLTLDRDLGGNYDGIVKKNLVDWLTETA